RRRGPRRTGNNVQVRCRPSGGSEAAAAPSAPTADRTTAPGRLQPFSRTAGRKPEQPTDYGRTLESAGQPPPAVRHSRRSDRPNRRANRRPRGRGAAAERTEREDGPGRSGDEVTTPDYTR